MKSFAIKFGVLIFMLIVTVSATSLIFATAEETEQKEPVDVRPVTSIELLRATDHQVTITSYGELMPLESTELAAQVSGEVLSWNEKFVAGGVVKRDDVLFTIESDTYEAEVTRAEAQVLLAEASLTEELARQKVAQREARNLPKNQVSDLYLRKPQVQSAKAQLKSAQASLRIAKRNLAKTKVTAPYDALVVSREIGSGQFVSAGMRVAKLNNIESAEVIVPIAGFDSPFLEDDPTQFVATVSTKDNTPVTREARINRNLGLIDQNTRMQHLVIRVEDPYALNSDLPALKFGTYVEVSFPGKELSNVYKVPQYLITNRKIWLVDDEDKLVSRAVNVVREEGSWFYISSGVDELDRMVKNLPEYPQEGMEVNIVDKDDNKGGQASNTLASNLE